MMVRIKKKTAQENRQGEEVLEKKTVGFNIVWHYQILRWRKSAILIIPAVKSSVRKIEHFIYTYTTIKSFLKEFLGK